MVHVLETAASAAMDMRTAKEPRHAISLKETEHLNNWYMLGPVYSWCSYDAAYHARKECILDKIGTCYLSSGGILLMQAETKSDTIWQNS